MRKYKKCEFHVLFFFVFFICTIRIFKSEKLNKISFLNFHIHSFYSLNDDNIKLYIANKSNNTIFIMNNLLKEFYSFTYTQIKEIRFAFYSKENNEIFICDRYAMYKIDSNGEQIIRFFDKEIKCELTNEKKILIVMLDSSYVLVYDNMNDKTVSSFNCEEDDNFIDFEFIQGKIYFLMYSTTNNHFYIRKAKLDFDNIIHIEKEFYLNKLQDVRSAKIKYNENDNIIYFVTLLHSRIIFFVYDIAKQELNEKKIISYSETNIISFDFVFKSHLFYYAEYAPKDNFFIINALDIERNIFLLTENFYGDSLSHIESNEKNKISYISKGEYFQMDLNEKKKKQFRNLSQSNIKCEKQIMIYENDDNVKCVSCSEYGKNFCDNNHKCCDECPYGYVSSISHICEKCKDGQSYFDNKCVNKCPKGYRSIDSICEKCSLNELFKYYNEKEGKCVEKCDENEIYNEEFICMKCEDNYVADTVNNKCVLKCPIGFVKEKDKCISCGEKQNEQTLYDEQMEQCVTSCDIADKIEIALSNSIRICTTCFAHNNTYYDPLTFKCESSIDVPYIEVDKLSHKIIKCYLKGLFVYNNKCVNKCPPYSQIEYPYNVCKLCSDVDMFYQDEKCVTSCEKGYELNNENKSCEKCPMYYNSKTKKCVTECERGEIGNEYGICEKCGNDLFTYLNKCVKSCKGEIDYEYNECIPCENHSHFYYNGQCLSECPIDTVTDFNMRMCYHCNDRNILINTFSDRMNNKCYRECPSYCVKSKDKCTCCKDSNMYYDLFNNICVISCEEDSEVDEINKICIKCKSQNKLYFNGRCVTECPRYYGEYENKCINCEENAMYLSNGKCVNRCPENSEVISSLNNFCMKCKEYDMYYDESKEKCVAICDMYSIHNDKGKTCKSCLVDQQFYFSDLNQCVNDCVFHQPSDHICEFKNKCQKESTMLNVYDNKCYSQCPNGYVNSPSFAECIKCKEQFSSKIYYYKGECISECPAYTAINKSNANFICEECNVYYSEQCYEKCPLYTEQKKVVSKSIICEDCSLAYDIKKNRCVNECEKGNVIDGICEMTCDDNLCLNGGKCENGECKCYNEYYGKYCQIQTKSIPYNSSYIISVNEDNTVKYGMKNIIYFNITNITNTMMSSFSIEWQFYIDNEKQNDDCFLTPKYDTMNIAIAPYCLNLNKMNKLTVNITYDNYIHNDTLIIILTPNLFHGDLSMLDIVIDKTNEKIMILSSKENIDSLLQFKFYFTPLKDNNLIPLSESFSYKPYYKGYIPSLSSITVMIKDINNEINSIVKDIHYINDESVSLLTNKNITLFINENKQLSKRDKFILISLNIDDIIFSVYDIKNCIDYILQNLNENNLENALMLMMKVVSSSKNERLRRLNNNEEIEKEIEIKVIDVMKQSIYMIDDIEKMKIIYLNINKIIQYELTNSLSNDIVNIINQATIQLNELNHMSAGEKVAILTKNIQIYAYRLFNQPNIDNISVYEHSYQNELLNDDDIVINDVTETNSSQLSFYIDNISIYKINSVDLLLLSSLLENNISYSISDTLFIYAKVKRESEQYPHIYTNLYLLPSSTYLNDSYIKDFYFPYTNNDNASPFSNPSSIACINLKDPNTIICKTYFNYTSNIILCRCSSQNPNSSIEIYPINDITLSSLSISYQYPKMTVSLLHPCIIVIIYPLLAFFIFTSLFVLYLDYSEMKQDNKDHLKYTIYSELKQRNILDITNANVFNIASKLILYFYPLISLFSIYHFKISRFHHLLYFLIRILLSFIFSLITFLITKFNYGDQFEKERNISYVNITKSQLPIRAIDVIFAVFISILFYYVIGLMMFVVAIAFNIEYGTAMLWKNIHSKLLLMISDSKIKNLRNNKKFRLLALRIKSVIRIEANYLQKIFSQKKDIFTNYLKLQHKTKQKNKNTDTLAMKMNKKIKNIESQASFSLSGKLSNDNKPKVVFYKEEVNSQTMQNIKNVFYFQIKPYLYTSYNLQFPLLSYSESPSYNYTYLSNEPNHIYTLQFESEKIKIRNYLIKTLILFLICISLLLALGCVLREVIIKYELYLYKWYIAPFIFGCITIDILFTFFYNIFITIYLRNRQKSNSFSIIDRLIGYEYIYYFKMRWLLIRFWKQIIFN